MFVIELVYKVDLAQIDAHMKAHMAFLRKHYAAGTFVVSGRKIPRDGGIILAVGADRAAIEAIAHEDPFVAKASPTSGSSSSGSASAPTASLGADARLEPVVEVRRDVRVARVQRHGQRAVLREARLHLAVLRVGV